ncbi:MAG: hypothetical protein M0Z36_09165 [Thermaerobacter sp.]|nr:hypothetical protein [Thermaerobacter sp.]
MRKLTPRQVSALSAALSAFVIGRAHAVLCSEDPAAPDCTLSEIVINSCQYCEEIQPGWWYEGPIPSLTEVGGISVLPDPTDIPAVTTIPFSPNNNPDCKVNSIHNNTIGDFIMSNEGGDSQVEQETLSNYHYKLTNETMYVPPDSSTHQPSAGSGCTVDGVDLHQWYTSQLEAGGAPASIFANPDIKMCMGPSGVTGAPAENDIYNWSYDWRNYGTAPLLTSTEGWQLFSAAFTEVQNGVQNDISVATNGTLAFAELPATAQAAIMDFSWYNDGGVLNNPNNTIAVQSLNFIANNNWDGLISYWKSLGGRYAIEAGELMQARKDGELPPTGAPCAPA